MTKIDIISGFLGAGKTTLIKKLLSDAYKGEQVVLIENEFGEIGIDGGFLKEAGIEIREMNSGCICCSLVGDFGKSLHEVVDTYHPDRILIEPSGVGKLSDVIKAVQDVQGEIDAELNSFTTVVDVTKCKIYRKNFGEFFSNQIEYAGAVILSRTDKAKPEKIQESVALLRELNEKAPIITTPIEQLPGEKILETMESSKSLEDELLAEVAKEAHDHEHHHHHDHEECDHEHHHHDHEDHEHHHHDHEEHEHEHHHHDHEEHEHEHHHHDGECSCGCGHHHHHDEGEAEEYGIGTFVYQNVKPFSKQKFEEFVFAKWPKEVIRAKGLFWIADDPQTAYIFEQSGKQKTATDDGKWIAAFPEYERKQILQMNPDIAQAWHPVYGDRVNKLVFIGRNMDKDAIIKALDDCIADEAK